MPVDLDVRREPDGAMVMRSRVPLAEHDWNLPRAFAGVANVTFLFCVPGSTSACRTAWEKIIRSQLDARTRPCNLATLRPRLKE